MKLKRWLNKARVLAIMSMIHLFLKAVKEVELQQLKTEPALIEQPMRELMIEVTHRKWH